MVVRSQPYKEGALSSVATMALPVRPGKKTIGGNAVLARVCTCSLTNCSTLASTAAEVGEARSRAPPKRFMLKACTGNPSISSTAKALIIRAILSSVDGGDGGVLKATVVRGQRIECEQAGNLFFVLLC